MCQGMWVHIQYRWVCESAKSGAHGEQRESKSRGNNRNERGNGTISMSHDDGCVRDAGLITYGLCEYGNFFDASRWYLPHSCPLSPFGSSDLTSSCSTIHSVPYLLFPIPFSPSQATSVAERPHAKRTFTPLGAFRRTTGNADAPWSTCATSALPRAVSSSHIIV